MITHTKEKKANKKTNKLQKDPSLYHMEKNPRKQKLNKTVIIENSSFFYLIAFKIFIVYCISDNLTFFKSVAVCMNYSQLSFLQILLF